MAVRTKPCDQADTEGRRKKAMQFLDAAETIRELADDEASVGDAFVTLCVHAGIAAADALCCRSLGHHASGESHAGATAELAKVDKGLSKDLRALLTMKTRAGYSSTPVSADQRRRSLRLARRLVDAAR